MRRNLIIALAMCFAAVAYGNAKENVALVTPHIERGAKHSRLDKTNHLTESERTNNGSWETVNTHVGDWGNSSCSMPGNVCVRGDYFFWWNKKEPPVAPNTIKGKDMKGKVPVKYDKKKKDYIWKKH